MTEIIFLGGSEEVGANSVFISVDGINFIVDTGLHPKRRDRLAFPQVEPIINRNIDSILITHAHTDHIGALPYVLKQFPSSKILMTYPTRDLLEILLRDTVKILKSDVTTEFDSSALEYYKRDHLNHLWRLLEASHYNQENVYLDYFSDNKAIVKFHQAGHILGSASISIDTDSTSILHSGDLNFTDSAMLKKASLPRHHRDILIMESTNGNTELPNLKEEINRFATYINKITNQNGVVLVPIFSTGKAQEILRILYSLKRKGSIPNLPIYTHGLTRRISRVYDIYCYYEGMKNKGFEVSDVEQEELILKDFSTSEIIRKPGIILANGGMVGRRTYAYTAAFDVLKKANSGIAIVGYQDEDTPGYAILNSQKKDKIQLGNHKIIRECEVEKFRFSAHSPREKIIEYILDVKPKYLFLNHGQEEAISYIAMAISEHNIGTKIIIPTVGKSYII
jgi:Cft2 family RNA processing exonuclease